MNRMINWVLKLKIWKDEAAQDMVEYALLAGFITIAVGAIFPPASDSISVIFSKLGSTAARVP